MYDRKVDGEELTFRFHPDLYEDNLLIQDLETKSKWSQLAKKAIDGPLEGAKLKALPALQTTWGHWKSRHPKTLVLSTELGLTGKFYEYRTHFSGGRKIIRGFSALEVVLGIDFGDVQKAYPFSQLKKTDGQIEDIISGQPITVRFDTEANSAYAADSNGQLIPAVTVYWESWLNFHPSTKVFVATR